ncbi:MAG: hypothetical protein HYS87_03655 [Candidatus Colwellbacteria bacterium]|nr:hypothetical protein [Candidatus Colwellbacteria bacterium]
MKEKIYIEKSDSVSSIVKKTANAEASAVVIYIPRFSKISSEPKDFKLLKREIENLGKSFEIESVDDDVLRLAKSVGIKSSNPFFRKNKKTVSDIFSPREGGITKDVPVEVGPEDIEEVKPAKSHTKKKHHTAKRSIINYILIALVIFVFLGGFYILPKADITLTMEKFSWDFSGTMLVSPTENTQIANSQIVIKGELFQQKATHGELYPASAQKEVEKHASGTLTIFNAYSSEPQPLVATTRFSAPDGKIYRISKGVTVPGAKIVNNEIVPSTINVEVVADKPGEEYNIAATKFRIPGFQGTARYEGFYAESYAPMTGGIVGTIQVPTNEDLVKAKESLRRKLESGLRAKMRIDIPEDIIVIDGASDFIITDENVEENVNSAGNFRLTSSATIRFFGFSKTDLIDAISRHLGSNTGLVAIEENFVYGEPELDFKEGEMTLRFSANSTWRRDLDLNALKEAIKGKKGNDLGLQIGRDSGINAVRVELWPFWVRSVPKNPDKITIDLQ